jgi:hypothetical protein
MKDKIISISLENYADQENLLVIRMEDKDIKVMSQSIMRQMIEYANAIKNQVEIESSDDDEETLAFIANEKRRRLTVGYKCSRLCKGPDVLVQERKVKAVRADNIILKAIKNFVEENIKKKIFRVTSYILRRQTLYLFGEGNQIKSVEIDSIKNFNLLISSKKVETTD